MFRGRYHEDALHDGVKGAVIGVMTGGEMAKGKRAVVTERAGIEGASSSGFTSIMGDGVKVEGRVVPGDGGARDNIDHFGGIIGSKGPKGYPQGRGSRHGYGTHRQQGHEEEHPSAVLHPRS